MSFAVPITDTWSAVLTNPATFAAVQVSSRIGCPVEFTTAPYGQPFAEEAGVEVAPGARLSAADIAALLTTATTGSASVLYARTTQKARAGYVVPHQLDTARVAYATQSEPAPLNTGAYVTTHTTFANTMAANTKDVALIGDSHVFRWGETGQGLTHWNQCLAAYPNATLLGIASDNTQGVLWRIANGALPRAASKTKVVCVQIGTNNSGTAGAEAAIVEAILRICRNINANMPWAEILLMGILPRGAAANDARIITVNNSLAQRYMEVPNVTYQDLRPFLTTSSTAGAIITSLFEADTLHLNTAGYGVWAAQSKPVIDRLYRRVS